MSDVGRVRRNNEDSWAICNLTTGEADLTPSLRTHSLGPLGSLFIVADGMGGEACGEVASQLCVDIVPQRLRANLQSLNSLDEGSFALQLREAIEHANRLIYQKAQSDFAYRGMGTTTTSAA